MMVEHWRREVDPKVVFQNVHHLLEDVGNGVSKSLCESPHVVGVFHLCAMMMVHVVSEHDENHAEDSVDTFDVMGKQRLEVSVWWCMHPLALDEIP